MGPWSSADHASYVGEGGGQGDDPREIWHGRAFVMRFPAIVHLILAAVFATAGFGNLGIWKLPLWGKVGGITPTTTVAPENCPSKLHNL